MRTITGYSAPESETASAFASRAAERDAERRLAVTLADQILQRLALGAAGLSGRREARRRATRARFLARPDPGAPRRCSSAATPCGWR